MLRRDSACPRPSAGLAEIIQQPENQGLGWRVTRQSVVMLVSDLSTPLFRFFPPFPRSGGSSSFEIFQPRTHFASASYARWTEVGLQTNWSQHQVRKWFDDVPFAEWLAGEPPTPWGLWSSIWAMLDFAINIHVQQSLNARPTDKTGQGE